MANVKGKYEVITADELLPGKVLLYSKPGSECYTNKHWHKNLEIDYVINGQMWTMQNNVDRDIGSGDFAIVNSECIHQTCGKYPDEEVKYLVVLFSYKFIKSYFEDFDEYRYDESIDDDAKIKIRDLLKSIVFEIENKNELSTLRLATLMCRILEILFDKCKVSRGDEKRVHTEDLEYAKKACEYIQANYKDKISLEDISAYVGLTPTYFSRYFKQSLNQTFKSYIDLVRLEHALLDIQNEGVSESKAAKDNGFASVKSFIAVFKSVYKCAPSEYTKKYHEEPPISEIRKL